MQAMEDRLLQSEGEPLSVSSALARAKNALESFTVKLIGEVSELNNKAGYKAVYFTVKDDAACLPCMMWLNRYQAAGVELTVGALVEITGRFTLYAPKGRMNFDVFGLALAGEGDLRLKVANLAKKLQDAGLMRPDDKKPVPQYPSKIGLVTSPRGAAVHDVLRTLRRRFPLAEILFAGVPVEGDQAASGMIEALRRVEAAGAEVVLLVRGGGSFEDLMPFNDEMLARTIAGLGIPMVTGIGHEPDTSIADMVADFRASTPTAAAEAASPSREAIASLFEAQASALKNASALRIERSKAAVGRLAAHPMFSDPNMLFATEAQMLDVTEERIHRAIPRSIERDRLRLGRMAERMADRGKAFLKPRENELSLKAARLHDLSPLIILSRGYAIAKNEEGGIVKRVGQVKPGGRLAVQVSDGQLDCVVEGVETIESSFVNWEE